VQLSHTTFLQYFIIGQEEAPHDYAPAFD
jgi:hypothetical protein